jgi:pyruvate dehydrogenase E2 component (dihydrolipoamide acetyltransferase)
MAEFIMPILGADMKAGTLTEWRKQPGDRVERGEIIAEIETDKADVEVECFIAGVVERLLVEPGDKVPVGTPLAIIHTEGAEEVAPAQAPTLAAPPLQVAPGPPRRRPAPPVPTPAAGRLRVSPSAKQLATELAVDLTTVTGTGPDGRIMRRDVELAAAPPVRPVEKPAEEAVDRQTRMRQAIAAAMSRSAREIPHFHVTSDIDMGPAMAWLTKQNEERPLKDRLLYAVLLIKAVALALHDFPELNGVWDGTRAVPNEAIHVGVAISLRGGGLVAPALHDTDKHSLGELMARFRDLVTRARAWSLRSSELSDPTITVTSLGEEGADTVLGLVYPPQVALVGFGRVTERPWSLNGKIVSRPVITATLSADHRVVDGHRGGLFLAAMERLLQEPKKL